MNNEIAGLLKHLDEYKKYGSRKKSEIESSDEFFLVLRGRPFSLDDLEVVARCIDEYFDGGRTRISQAICEELDWRQPNGWLKERACRDVLLRLERMGIVSLPPPHIATRLVHKENEAKLASYLVGYDLSTPITQFPRQITLEFSKGNKAEKIWDELVGKFHYRGHQVTVGRCIKYLVKSEEML